MSSRFNINVKDCPGLVAGHCEPGTVFDDPELMAVPVGTDENGVPCAMAEMSGGGGKAVYDFVNARATEGLKMHFLPGTWHCCVVDADILEPMLARDGDRYMIYGICAGTGRNVSSAVTRENLLCMLGRDKLGRCGCGGRGGRVDS